MADTHPTTAVDGDKTNAALRAEIQTLEEKLERVRRNADKLVALWPDDRGSSPVIYHHSDGTCYLETLRGDRWAAMHAGPYASKREAVVAFLLSQVAPKTP